MRQRMLCTECHTVSVPETVLEGSDRTELLSWICLGLPGWLYCSWRHALRQKVCAQCGSGAVIREAIRSRRIEVGAPRWTHGRVAAPRRWPRALATPRERLLHGGVAAALAWAAALGWLMSDPAALVLPRWGLAFALLFCCWIAFQAARVRRCRAPACWARDERGRALSVEWL